MNKVVADAAKITGCIDIKELSIHYLCCSFLKDKYKKFNSAEIGYYCGRSSYVPLNTGTSSHLVIDPYAHLSAEGERANGNCRYDIDTKDKRVTFLLKDSADMAIEKDIKKFYGKVDFMVIDGLHTAWHLKNDLELATKLLSDKGFLIIDDYGSFPGVRNATEEFLKNNKDFKLFMYMFNEVCLCRADIYNEYFSTFVKQEVYKMPEINEEIPWFICGPNTDSGYSLIHDGFCIGFLEGLNKKLSFNAIQIPTYVDLSSNNL